MKKISINGVPVPYGAPIQELLIMLNSGNMQQFMLASEALSYRTDRESYEAMKKYLSDKDYYKRLYILEPIFRHPLSEDIIYELENALKSEDQWFARHALVIIIKQKTEVNDELILSAVKRFKFKLDLYYYQSLYQLHTTEKNYAGLIELYNTKGLSNSHKTIVAEALYNFATDERYEYLFSLFFKNPFAKIRIVACRIAKKHNRSDLLDLLRNDENGHVRKQCRI